MAINITPTTIQVGNFKFRETDTGIEFTGQAKTLRGLLVVHRHRVV